jgi:hypothetical protein
MRQRGVSRRLPLSALAPPSSLGPPLPSAPAPFRRRNRASKHERRPRGPIAPRFGGPRTRFQIRIRTQTRVESGGGGALFFFRGAARGRVRARDRCCQVVVVPERALSARPPPVASDFFRERARARRLSCFPAHVSNPKKKSTSTPTQQKQKKTGRKRKSRRRQRRHCPCDGRDGAARVSRDRRAQHAAASARQRRG